MSQQEKLAKRNYFEPLDEEDYFYTVDSNLNKKYEALESIYNSIFSSKTTQEAKDISLYIRNKKNYIDKSLTYGEITFRTMAYIIEYCKNHFNIDQENEFIDLGSGIGTAVIAAALCHNFKKYIGAEYISALNEKAKINKNKLIEKIVEIKSDEKNKNNFLPYYTYEKEFDNKIVVEKEEEEEEEKKEDEIPNIEVDETEEIKINEEDNMKNFLMGNQKNAQNILDIIFGKEEDETPQSGEIKYMSYAKKQQLYNQKFLEDYDKKQEIIEKKKIIEEKKNPSNKKGQRKTIHDLIHGQDGFLKQLQEQEKQEEEEKKKQEKEKENASNNKDTNQKNEKEEKKKIIDLGNKNIIIPYIELTCGNFMDLDLSNAALIFCNSTCFSSELLKETSKKISRETPTGCVVISLTKKLPFLNSKDWEIQKGFKRLMSFGAATVYVHQRINSMYNTQTSGSSKHSSSSYCSRTLTIDSDKSKSNKSNK